jgi:pyruvate/2-oxoglutarate dehydrogenase complex dihydrolipoamide acyltransferase (E2) component
MMVRYHNVNISVAVQTEHGLMVPVVKDADKKGLSTISEDVKVLAGKARSNTLKPQDYEVGYENQELCSLTWTGIFCNLVIPSAFPDHTTK